MITRNTTIKELKDMICQKFQGQKLDTWDISRLNSDGALLDGLGKMISKTVKDINSSNYSYCSECRGQLSYYLNGYLKPLGINIMFRRTRQTVQKAWGTSYEYYFKSVEFVGFADTNTVDDILKVVEQKCLNLSDIVNDEADKFVERLQRLGITWKDVETLSSDFYKLSSEARQIVKGERSRF